MANAKIRFDDQAIIVTGAGRGLGRAQALLLAARGAKVVVADNGSAMDGEDPDHTPAETVVSEIVEAGGEAVACTADLATESGSLETIDVCMDAFSRVDGLIHYASTSPDLTPPDQLSSHDLDLVMRVNPFAGIWMARAAWPHMVNQQYGRIVFMPSAALYGALGNTHYAAAKAAYLGIVRCLALEGDEKGILVNAVMPAARTRMTERFHPSAFADWFFETMTPEKVAVGAAYLLSSACSVNGEIFAVGGGRIARVAIAESEGVGEACSSLEEVHDAMPRVMADANFFYPKDLSERSIRVNRLLGFEGGLNATSSYAVKNSKDN